MLKFGDREIRSLNERCIHPRATQIGGYELGGL